MSCSTFSSSLYREFRKPGIPLYSVYHAFRRFAATHCNFNIPRRIFVSKAMCTCWHSETINSTTVEANRTFGRFSEFHRLLSNLWIFWKLFYHRVLYMCVVFTCGFIRCSLLLLFWPLSSHTALSPHNPPCWIENVSTTWRHTAESRDVLAREMRDNFEARSAYFERNKIGFKEARKGF